MENNFKYKVKKVYDLWSKSYDKEDNPALFTEKNFAINMLNLNKKDIVLDYGCGTGRNIRAILKLTGNVYGVDISEEMLSIARKKYSNIIFKSTINKNKIPFDNFFLQKFFVVLLYRILKILTDYLKNLIGF